MQNARKLLLSLVPAMAGLWTGCSADDVASGQADRLPVTVVWQSQHCNVTTAVVREIESQADWQSIAKQSSTRIGDSSSTAMALDLDAFTYSLIALGAKPNPGYGLEVTSDQGSYTDGVLVLPVSETQPDPEKMYAQMMVSPCVVLATPLVGKVIDITLR